MTGLGDIELLRPLWLVALPLIAGLAVLAHRRQGRIGDWSRMIDPHLMRAMAEMGRIDLARSIGARQLPFWTAALICLGLAGPALKRDDAQTWRNLGGVVFVVDVSASMTASAHWSDVILAARSGLQVLGTRPAALIVYAGDAYAATSLTTDTRHLGQTMALLDATTVPDKGSRPALALRMAAGILRDTSVIAGDVVLLSDGEGLGPDALAAAREIGDLGGRLLVVQVPGGVTEAAPASPEAMESLALAGAGQRFTLGDTEPFLSALGRDDDPRLELQGFRLVFWSDYGRYLVLLALIPLALLFRREEA